MLQPLKSFFIFNIVLSLGLTACGGGGDGDNANTNNTGLFRSMAAERTPDELDGTWSGELQTDSGKADFRLAISEDDRVSLGAQCKNPGLASVQVQVTVKAKITNDTIELLENAEDKKPFGDGECGVAASQGYIVAYRLNGYELTIIDGGEEILLTKMSD